MSTNEPNMFKTYYDIGKSTIWGEQKAEDTGTPRILISFKDGNPSFVVSTGEKGVFINFPTDYYHFMAMLEKFEVVVRSSNGVRTTMNSKTYRYDDNNQRTNDLRVVSTLHMGKSKEGLIYLILEQEGKPKIAFGFKNSKFHDLNNESNEPEPIEQTSKYFALGYIKLARNMMGNAIMNYTREAYNKGEYKPGVIGGNAPNGKQQQNYKKPQTKSVDFDNFEDDLPY